MESRIRLPYLPVRFRQSGEEYRSAYRIRHSPAQRDPLAELLDALLCPTLLDQSPPAQDHPLYQPAGKPMFLRERHDGFSVLLNDWHLPTELMDTRVVKQGT